MTAGRVEELPSVAGWREAEPSLCWWRTNAAGEVERYDARSEGQIEYEVLRSTIVAAFNPPDDDIAEPALMTATLDRVWRFLVGLPCTCPPGAVEFEDDPCGRCAVLGRAGDQAVAR